MLRCLLSLLLCGVVYGQTTTQPSWPDRICINADDRVLNNQALYGPTTWIAPRVQRMGAYGDKYETCRFLVAGVQEAVWGLELSSITVRPAHLSTGYPPECIDPAMFRTMVVLGSWPGDSNRKILDITDDYTGDRQAHLLAERWREAKGVHWVFLDNAPHMYEAQLAGKFESALDFVGLVSESARQDGVRLVWNFLAVDFVYLEQHNYLRLCHALRDHAVMMEQPYPAIYDVRPDLRLAAQHQYMRLGDLGIPIVMIETGGRPAHVWAWVGSWRRAGVDRIYMTSMFNGPDLFPQP